MDNNFRDKMVKIIRCIIISCLISFAVIGCAQNNYKIRNSYSFFSERFPGNIPVDDKGNPMVHGPDTVYMAMLEIDTASTVKWEKAFYKGKTFNAYLEDNFLELIDKENQPNLEIIKSKPKSGYQMIFLSLQKTTIDTIPAYVSTKLKNDSEVLLEGVLKNKTIHVVLPEPLKLNTLPGY